MYAYIVLEGTGGDCEFVIEETGGKAVESIALLCHTHGYIGEDLTEEDAPKYRIALQQLCKRADEHAGEKVVWIAP